MTTGDGSAPWRVTGSSRHVRQAGFTLIEVLAAIAIVAVMLGSVGTALRLMSDAAARGTREIDRIDMISRGLAAIRKDITRMERAVVRERDGLRFSFEGESRQMSFVVIEPSYPSDPGSYVVTYAVRAYGSGAQLVRARDVHDPGQGPRRAVRDEAAEVVVLEGPYRFELSYLPPLELPQKWTQRWSEKAFLPALVRLEAVSTDPRVPSMPTLVARPRVNAEATCMAGATQPCSARTGRLVGIPPQK